MTLKYLFEKQLQYSAQGGSILLELLVVMVIVSVVMVGMITSFGNISRGQAKADRRLEATQYAIEGMEAIYNLSRNDFVAGWPLVISLKSPSSSEVNANYISLDTQAATYEGIFSNMATAQKIDGNGTYERKLWFYLDSPSDMMVVESKVCWDNGCSGSDPTKEVVFTSKFVGRPL